MKITPEMRATYNKDMEEIEQNIEAGEDLGCIHVPFPDRMADMGGATVLDVVETETDALLLESDLIKKYKPKYNILLKDDKSYPWICIKNEPFPRIFQTRTVIKDGSEYYGPYTSHKLVKTMLAMFKKLYFLRTCKLQLNDENIKKALSSTKVEIQ